MECKSCTHNEVCKYKEKFEMCQGTNDRKPFNDVPIVVESKCLKYESKNMNICCDCSNQTIRPLSEQLFRNTIK